MEFTPQSIPEVILVTPKLFQDARGFFMETYKASTFKPNGMPLDFVQDNQSYSVQGTLRGLHYQLEPHPQGKLVRCLAGEIFDVAVDIRHGSPYYGQWVGAVLNAETHQMLYVPPGFAHGFLVLSPTAHVHYKTTGEYAASADRGIRWDDPAIDIEWPINSPLLSDKDKTLPLLSEAENNFSYASQPLGAGIK